ncbi:MAG: DUF2202 domain-containing protein [Ignavibacteria bacterium]
MKIKILFIVALLALTSIIAAVFPNNSNRCTYRLSSASESITPQEEQNLVYMREEEKLAHDFYTLMLKKYDHRVFKNISKAETMHGSFIKELLDRYLIADPSIGKNEGEFSNSDLAALYKSLTEKGSISLNDALKCGAEIEELDITDLNSRIDESSSQDIKETFINLKEGSQRHLQAFVRNLKAAGETYTPIHLSQQKFDDIIQTSDAKTNKCGDCYYDGNGNRGNGCNGNQCNGNGYNQKGCGENCKRK